MQMPYTPLWADAQAAAMSGTAVCLTAALMWKRARSMPATLLFAAGIWIATLLMFEVQFFDVIHVRHFVKHPLEILDWAALLVTLGALAAGPRWIGGVALVGGVALHVLGRYLVDSDVDLAIAHVVWFAFVIGLVFRNGESPPARNVAPGSSSPSSLVRPSFVRDDVCIFLFVFVLAALVSRFILHNGFDSADETAYAYQAMLLAGGKAYTSVPPCWEAHQNHWVFYYHERAFVMYTPGWPLFMAPFHWFHAIRFAAPAALGIMAVGVARLGRRAASFLSDDGVSGSRVAGIAAALIVSTGVSMVLNGGGYYCNIFVCTTYAVAAEAVFVVVDDPRSPRAKALWGLLLGTATALCLGTRPADGAVLGLAIFVYFANGVLKRNVGWPAFAGTAAAFVFWGGLILIILRLQLGVWFKTGYSIAPQYFAWATVDFGFPHADDVKTALPLGSGTYCFWPCAPALGILGALLTRGRGQRVLAVLTVGAIIHESLYFMIIQGRHLDWGYGPRYRLPTLIPIAVFTGVLVARLWEASRSRRARFAGAPLALVVAAFTIGVVRIGIAFYPPTHTMLHAVSAIHRAVDAAHLKNAIVVMRQREVHGGPLLDTQNDPLDPNPDVLYLGDVGTLDCVRKAYPDRKMYRARGIDEVTLTPE